MKTHLIEACSILKKLGYHPTIYTRGSVYIGAEISEDLNLILKWLEHDSVYRLAIWHKLSNKSLPKSLVEVEIDSLSNVTKERIDSLVDVVQKIGVQ